MVCEKSDVPASVNSCGCFLFFLRIRVLQTSEQHRDIFNQYEG